jgi:cytochrome c5
MKSKWLKSMFAVGLASVAGAYAGGTLALERSGKAVVDAVCQECHRTGAYGAPRISDATAWQERAQRGLSSLTANAVKGIRNMPAHGGNPNVTDLEIARAITYMVNQSGGNWTEPAEKLALLSDRSGKSIVQARCITCHEAGKGGAPRIGDRAAWIPRMKNGFDVVVRSAIHGHGGMPARGGVAEFTDNEIRQAVLYMFHAEAPAK